MKFRKTKPPCIISKCIKFPACKNKEHVHCTELKDYYLSMARYYTGDNLWRYIKKFLPELESIYEDNGRPTPPPPRIFH